ncbi:unnamed protein product [Musa textilis]
MPRAAPPSTPLHGFRRRPRHDTIPKTRDDTSTASSEARRYPEGPRRCLHSAAPESPGRCLHNAIRGTTLFRRLGMTPS